MSHGARVYPDLFYTAPNVPAASWWETVDLTLSKAINGDGGGNWAPTANIVIGGAGLVLSAAWTLSSGATLNTPNGSGKRVVHGDSDYFQLKTGHTGATRTIIQNGGEFSGAHPEFTTAVQYDNPHDAAIVSLTVANGLPKIFIPLGVHNGATISQVVFSFAVGQSHASVPSVLPNFRVCKSDVNGTITPLNSTTGNTSGFLPFTPTPGSGAAWFAAGATQTFTYPIDASTVIDTSKYSYFAEIIDENGTNIHTGNLYFSAKSTFTTILDQRPQ